MRKVSECGPFLPLPLYLDKAIVLVNTSVKNKVWKMKNERKKIIIRHMALNTKIEYFMLYAHF